ncbi:hypothetical protein GCM10020331_089370 [Ectobacillus funiculus]
MYVTASLRREAVSEGGAEMKGYIHSIESYGTVDGPGIRYIVFMQGCLLRCQYCHNPDTWGIGKGKEVTVEEIIEDVKKAISRLWRRQEAELLLAGENRFCRLTS